MRCNFINVLDFGRKYDDHSLLDFDMKSKDHPLLDWFVLN
jgi:hypothetical protein